jgi:hypothetical protein
MSKDQLEIRKFRLRHLNVYSKRYLHENFGGMDKRYVEKNIKKT